MWIWQRPSEELSPTLTELVAAAIGRQPAAVIEVLDTLAVADPVEVSVLAAISGCDAIDAAEAAGLISIDTDRDAAVVRMAHPLFGEVRRARAGTMRLRHLRGRVATGLGALGDRRDLVQLVRRAALVVDSDLAPDPAQLIDASSAALELMDPATAERLAAAAVTAGGGRRAQVVHVRALVNCDRLADALRLNAEVRATASTDRQRTIHTLGRVMMLLQTWNPHEAERELDAVRESVVANGLERPYNCTRAVLSVTRGRPRDAVETAIAGLTESGWTHDVFELVGVTTLVIGLAESGRFDAVGDWAEKGYELSRATVDYRMLRFVVGMAHINACGLAGQLTAGDAVGQRLAREPMDHPVALAYRALLLGSTALARGDLALARGWFGEAGATAATLETVWISRYRCRMSAMCLAMAGDPANASALLHADPYPADATGHFEHVEALAHAWVHAAAGTTSEAIADLRQFATRAQERGLSAGEVICLQTAAQFGDTTCAERLTELALIGQGLRASTAARHATALRDRDGTGLREAAALYEAFGDRVAAADAAAQAAMVFRDQGRRGAAMTATALARRLAHDTGADTPALRANTCPIPLTPRQREILALAATGLSNRQIADRLVMSVRTVEGHLFRAHQKTGVSGRQELIALLETK